MCIRDRRGHWAWDIACEFLHETGTPLHGEANRRFRARATLPLDMPKNLVIAEKPSVGRDLARVLEGPSEKHEGWLEGPHDVITWAVGHLVQLAEPDEYDERFKKWRMADLPIAVSYTHLRAHETRH